MRKLLFLLALLPLAAFGQMQGGVMESQQRAASNITGVVGPANGGTGVANNAAATLTRSGNHALTITTTGTASLNVGTGGTLTNAAYACYATGSWTPAYGTSGTAYTSVTYDAVTAGIYTRIGNLVFVQGGIRTDAITVGSASGNLQITGLPFVARAAGSDLASRAGLNLNRIATFSATTPNAAEIVGGTSVATLFYRAAVDGGQSAAPASSTVGTGADANFVTFSGVYTTDAACP